MTPSSTTPVPSSEVESLRDVLPKAAPVGSVNAGRIVGGSAVVVGAFAAIVVVVRALPAVGWWADGLAVLLGLLVVPMVASVLEWFVHRFVYHQAVLRPLAQLAIDQGVQFGQREELLKRAMVEAAVQATRRARSMSPAPIAMPTIGTAATPIPNEIGMSRNSSRCPIP